MQIGFGTPGADLLAIGFINQLGGDGFFSARLPGFCFLVIILA
jgi:hypothetical protein